VPGTGSAADVELRTERVTIGGLELCVRSAPGPGPPLVMVHGLGVSSRYMLPLARRLAPHRALHLPDLPGFGDSGKPPKALGIEEMADCLADWARAIGLPRADFFGHSLGCQVVVDLAVRYPQQVGRLVLVAPTIDIARRTVTGELVRLLRDAPREPAALLPIVVRDYWKAGTRRLLRTLRFALCDPVEEKLPAVAVPALVMRGEDDPVVSQAWVEEVRRRLPRGRLGNVPGAAHAVHFSAPVEVATRVLRFLAEE